MEGGCLQDEVVVVFDSVLTEVMVKDVDDVDDEEADEVSKTSVI